MYIYTSLWMVLGFTLHVNVMYIIHISAPDSMLPISSAAKIPVRLKVNPFNTLI